MKSAISIKGLTKTYENGFQALKGIDLEVNEGDFFALLGPNGAGKSTTIGIITSLVNKNDGKVKIFDVDIDEDFDLAKTYIGVVPQEFNFNIFETPYQIVCNQGGYYGMEKNLIEKRAEKYLKKLGLWEKKDGKSIELSGGMKRRLMIARALIHEPRLLILDEPTAGVDVELRNSMWEFIKEINEKGMTIILTTHYLEEAEALCRNIAIIDNGNIIENTSMKTLLKKSNTQAIIMDLDKDIRETPKIKSGEIIKVDKNTIEVKFPNSISVSKIFEELSKLKLNVVSMRNKKNKLEGLFIELTGGQKNGKK